MYCHRLERLAVFSDAYSAQFEIVDHVCGSTRILPSHGSSADARLPQVCPALRWKPLRQIVPLPLAVSLHGVRAVGSSREFARHRGLSARPAQQALPHGHSRQDRAQHAGQRQQTTRLADLCGVCPGVDPHRASALCRGRAGPGTRQRRLRARRLDHRPVPFRFPVGVVSVPPSPPSSFIRCSTCAATSQLSFIFRTASSAT